MPGSERPPYPAGIEPALDPTRLAEIGAHLDQSASEVAGTLRSELERALVEIDAGLAAGDAPAVALAAHAARNSALMITAHPTLAVLNRLETAARAGDLSGASEAAAQLREPWSALRAGLRRAVNFAG